jgi:hypothetical protein
VHRQYASGLEPLVVCTILYGQRSRCSARCSERARIGLWRVRRQLLLGLVELHALGIIHRNLKPSKILFDPANKYACSRYNGAWDTT